MSWSGPGQNADERYMKSDSPRPPPESSPSIFRNLEFTVANLWSAYTAASLGAGSARATRLLSARAEARVPDAQVLVVELVEAVVGQHHLMRHRVGLLALVLGEPRVLGRRPPVPVGEVRRRRR